MRRFNRRTTLKQRKERIPLVVRRQVWHRWIGEEIGKTRCPCCGLSDITQLSFHCGHVRSEARGGRVEVDNLRPICGSCNSSMGTSDMNAFMRRWRVAPPSFWSRLWRYIAML